MIMNDLQYEITREWVGRFQESVDRLRQHLDEGDDNTQKLRRIQEAAYLSEIDVLRGQLAEYDALRSGQPTVVRLDSLADLPRALIKARISAGLTQRDLAERLEVEEEVVQRDEEEEYESAPLTRLREVAELFGVTIGGEVSLPVRPAQAA